MLALFSLYIELNIRRTARRLSGSYLRLISRKGRRRENSDKSMTFILSPRRVATAHAGRTLSPEFTDNKFPDQVMACDCTLVVRELLRVPYRWVTALWPCKCSLGSPHPEA